MEPELLVVLVTAPVDQAESLAETWVSKRWAACANVVREVKSLFWWDGGVDREKEALIVLKTAPDGFDTLARGIRDTHPYDVPEIIALPVSQADEAYAEWVRNEVRGAP